MAGTYRPVDAGDGDRAILRSVLDQLGAAGYELRGSALVNKTTGAGTAGFQHASKATWSTLP